MRRVRIVLIVLMVCSGIVVPKRASAIIPILEIIKAGVKKVIKAVDLKIQREQNRIIWLQNAQKVLENEMSKLKLDQIKEWTQKQKDLYQNYFEELRKVKMIISYYQRIRLIADKQRSLVNAYAHAWSLFKNDRRFSPKELEYMGKVYNGILNETISNIDQISLVVNSFRTQMTDAERLKIINQASERVEQNYSDLLRFNYQNSMLSLQRAKTAAEIQQVRKLYGLH